MHASVLGFHKMDKWLNMIAKPHPFGQIWTAWLWFPLRLFAWVKTGKTGWRQWKIISTTNKHQIKCLISQILFLVLCVLLVLGNAHLEWRGSGLTSSQKRIPESLNGAFGSSGEQQQLSRAPSFLGFLDCQDGSSPFWTAADKASQTLHPK